MKTLLTLITFLSLLTFPVLAQMPVPIGPPPEDVPLQGLVILAAFGGAYALKKLRGRETE